MLQKTAKQLILVIFCLLIHFNGSAQNLDIDILKNINLNRNPALDKTFSTISQSVYPVSLASTFGCLGVGFIKDDKKLKRKGIDMLSSLAVSVGTTYFLKKAIQRERPYDTYPFIQNYYSENDYSMPSGHTTAAFSTATSLSLAFPKWYVAVPAFAYAGAVGYSRMHLGVHYPSDVLMGAAIGAGSAWITYKANKWIRRGSKVAKVVGKL